MIKKIYQEKNAYYFHYEQLIKQLMIELIDQIFNGYLRIFVGLIFVGLIFLSLFFSSKKTLKHLFGSKDKH